MGSINDVYIYKCDTCLRSVERTNDGRHPDPLRCVITNKCRGLMALIGSRNGKPRMTPPIIGLDDRIVRGTTPDSSIKAPIIAQASLASFIGGGGLTLAGLRQTISTVADFHVTDINDLEFSLETRALTYKNPLTSTITAVLYEVSPSVLEYRHYMFTFHGTAAIVQGQDDTPERGLLRFSASSSLRVYANGIELVPSAYDRTIDNQITLTPQLNDSLVIIDVYVYKDVIAEFDEDTAIRLDFTTLLLLSPTGIASRNECAWGNVSAVVTADGVTRMPLFCTSLAAINKDKSYGIQRFEATSTASETRTLKASALTFLLAAAPYSFNDKRTYRFLTGDKLINGAVITFVPNEASGDLEPMVDESYITQVYEPITIATWANARLSNTASSETTPQQRTKVTPRKYIIGPS